MAKLEDLGAQVGDQIIVRGTVSFSELAERVEGQKLLDKIERQKKLNMFPINDPHYSVTIVDVEIEPEYLGTPLAQYYGDQVYTNKDGKLALTLVSKSNFPPAFFHEQEDGTAVQLDNLEAELGTGQEIKVLINTFGSKRYANMGSGVNAILLPAGNINYYSNTASASIAAFGLKLSDDPAPSVQSKEEVVEDANANPFGASATTETKVETSPVDNVPADAKPAPNTGTNVDNPFA